MSWWYRPTSAAVVRARGLAKRITPLAIIDKRRERAGDPEVMNVIDVAGYTCVLVDDIVDPGGTLVNAADALLENKAKAVYAYISHGVLWRCRQAHRGFPPPKNW